MKIKARAKINWTLDITGKRADGYHTIDSVMQPLTLCDEMEFNTCNSEEITLTINGMPLLAPDENNLILRAARALQESEHIALGVRIIIEKKIPMGAGLGGGSADAAATLKALNLLWKLNIPSDKLAEIGLSLGADVPFCLLNFPARTQGIGEILTPFSVNKAYSLLLIQPCAGLSTKEIFSRYDHLFNKDGEAPNTQLAIHALKTGNTTALKNACKNVLQTISESVQPEIRCACDALRTSGALIAQMTGSGSVVFGVFESKKQADVAYSVLKEKYSTLIAASTAL